MAQIQAAVEFCKPVHPNDLIRTVDRLLGD
jgi:hypothetical protein